MISLLGFPQPIFTNSLIQTAERSKSPAEILHQLAKYGFSSSNETREFAEELYARVPRPTAGERISESGRHDEKGKRSGPSEEDDREVERWVSQHEDRWNGRDNAASCSPDMKALREEYFKKSEEELTDGMEDELIKAVEHHRVLVIEGETKQIPQYLHKAGYTSRGKKIGCTKPRRVAAMSIAASVARELGVTLGHEVGYSIRFKDCTSEKTLLKYMTDGVLLRELLVEPDLGSYTVIMVDEAHERSISTDILLGLLKDLVRSRPDLRLIISTVTLQAEKFSDYFGSAPVFKMPGHKYPVQMLYHRMPGPDYLESAISKVLQICATEPLGDILVFLTDQEDIETAEQILKKRIEGLSTKILELIICPLDSNLPTDVQAKAFEPTPKGSRKIVLATDIAETSETVDGIKHVVDPGYCKLNSYNPTTGVESLLLTPISKVLANLRADQSGRTCPGKCFRLYDYNDLKDNTVPEIQRADLAGVVLALKSLGIQDLFDFDFMDPPPHQALFKALELLYALGALDEDGEMTEVGQRMVEFPVDPMLSKMIVASDKYKCSEEITSIAAMLSLGDSIFHRPKHKQVQADNARMSFHTGNVGDHIALLRIYSSWKETNYSTQWCYDNYIQVQSMKRARDICKQLEGLLRRVGIELSSNPNDLDAIRKAILAGFFSHSAKLENDGTYRRVENSHTVSIHPSSGLLEVAPRWVVCHELVLTTKEYMHQITEFEPKWLVEVAPPRYHESKDVEDEGSKGVGRAPM
ncbi:PREDICTED: pre-mRNA-splicing factor ATP-dependent RNA helicase DEAH1-like [Tarenaya hassleriana]|uniref:pre-mRNA-splicing factor ATP-dependent RNA helicase DEAH1-like n=1 Tax=Tarenaya hassleriana TaxID=28532 RepID=UPI0008FCF760|nr:PREDICTED: pre-mRNA-splicing factor ATP-dependent RNA helicase DEAH1-like [Tarenaya hassleriana]XP_019058187.1 PREDICTED: pre-mRNA-splicing factor ATP-dependent RNA helicase DEAH1-like [Tarenaya hassleriana]XP_019058188.1 PREDICTED: pre-mRNA-splicing factor ATP-dependent RNA helicase DEAH1-like [Tarenaya hassleriana]XP_019058190.1 PREDICTED: pre-mRNA-splicing factor ATP-dependent RNA helicase DEAH1-like [Tarenaya hassleriana]